MGPGTIIALLGLLAVTAAGGFWGFRRQFGDGAIEPLTYNVAITSRGTVVSMANASGTVSASRQVKISAPYRSPGCDHRALTSRLLAEAGPERLLFGSDWPFVGHETKVSFKQTVNWFEEFVPDPVTRGKIGRTAARLYRFA